MVIQRIKGPNWHSAEGVELKRAQIRKKGVPDMRNWRLITLTMDQGRFDGPEEAYLKGKDNLRRFLNSLRDLLGVKSARWCWKLEFQRNGWPHWHLAFDYRTKLTETELKTIEVIWGLGITNVKRIQNGSFEYLFKYVTKESFAGDDDELLPDWFLDYLKERESDGKPVTFHRVRFWQTSKGFYTGDNLQAAREKKEPATCRVPLTVRQALEIRGRTVRVIAQDEFGRLCRSTQITLKRAWKGSVEPLLARLCLTGLAAAPGPTAYICGHPLINTLCQKHDRKKLLRLLPYQQLDETRQIQQYLRAMGIAMPF